MKCYIVTPTYNSIQWLKGCVRSVAEQVVPGIEVHHHVQDGASQDGTAEWLAEWQTAHNDVPGYRFTFESAKDAGMYDAINIAWDRMPDDADMTAHLNSDEQYLPGVLKRVAECWLRKPKADVLLGTYIVLNKDYQYVCHRRPVQPRAWSSRLNCTCITNSSFYSARMFRRLVPRFDTRWKCQGDLVFYRDLLRLNVRFEVIDLVTSLFVSTGSNLAWTERAHQEWLEICAEQPVFWRKINGFVYRWVNFKRRLVDLGAETPKSYSVFEKESGVRSEYDITDPTVIWRWELM